MLNELLGKNVQIVMGLTTGFSEYTDDVNGKIAAMDAHWLKVLDKKKTVLVNVSKIKRIVLSE